MMNGYDSYCFHDVASISLDQLLMTKVPKSRLLPIIEKKVELAVAQFVSTAYSNFDDSNALPAQIACRKARHIPVIPLRQELCTLMTRVGFDKDLFTYGEINGAPVGYVEEVWLLKFLGLPDDRIPAQSKCNS